MKPEEIDRIDEAKAKIPEATLVEFFESKPDNVIFRIRDLTLRVASTGPSSVSLSTPKAEQFNIPAIRLWCDSDECDGIRIFDPDKVTHPRTFPNRMMKPGIDSLGSFAAIAVDLEKDMLLATDTTKKAKLY